MKKKRNKNKRDKKEENAKKLQVAAVFRSRAEGGKSDAN
jgi:hypothetical protein